jgi:methyl-accepting chemotaxis protein
MESNMFKNLKFKYKIFIIPALAILSFIISIFITRSFTKKNEVLIDEIVNGYAPAWELNRDLVELLDSIQRTMQDAVIAADEEKLLETEGIRNKFVTRIENERNNFVFQTDDLDALARDFNEYYNYSKQISQRMIQGYSDESILNATNTMKESGKAIREKLDKNILRNKHNMSTTLSIAQRNNRMLMIVSVIIILLFIALLCVLTFLIVTSISGSLNTAIEVTEKVANGDLTVEVTTNNSKDEVGILLSTFQKMVKNLRNLTVQIKEGANALASAASEISASVTQIAAGATETATAANQTSATVEEVRQTAQDSNRKAKHVSESAQKAVQVSQTGEKAVTETINGMHRIQAQMESIAESIMKLSEHGQAIGGIIATVEDVAEQSNLLAVNASIEAAKAGEQGKGFAVVAQEVKNLAEQSQQATARVRNILDDIQKATSGSVMTTEQGSKAVEAGVKQSMESGEAIQRLANSVAEAAQATTQIAVSSQEQLVGMDQMVSAMESIKQASTQNVAATKQVETAARDLGELGQKLKDVVEQSQV